MLRNAHLPSDDCVSVLSSPMEGNPEGPRKNDSPAATSTKARVQGREWGQRRLNGWGNSTLNSDVNPLLWRWARPRSRKLRREIWCNLLIGLIGFRETVWQLAASWSPFNKHRSFAQKRKKNPKPSASPFLPALRGSALTRRPWPSHKNAHSHLPSCDAYAGYLQLSVGSKQDCGQAGHCCGHLTAAAILGHEVEAAC
ncbi:PREDICTED: uncharacterized protein LOC105575773 [Cercocebus atys]|uniref:uncharacterized protein LOC105575773 n=1 Tax=Cercocebus atys TaxID=9531 RepID=UPI0005F4306C|nr:PREDICTED: uncharacterized protein LOC105575773 [Cercocebus atys]XP_011893395.1 PREDICTED: uncharacterized protein LOC105575773 [Cercocebus atys]